ncbi:DUF262 domain-containing protein [Erysipelothrix rhusiopathiae]|uniref:DUF262 domain-containing protein n=1 Tax=Erysipelothrix rhusiopathiae TaxID=1648 RepID=UPI0023B0B0F3|nr:DUF262 domain-containing protein [Erysipelothrix rhusiopathiae]MDE8037320.1 DUF262 domain-containing protein [Erysipelothrix rhusiopathiae]MDE8038663.1 DUF262 domain-containing protein [Erysipelothrix rhusiopathiae]MDE8057284.1 DUF262 domain-containing protein [Erysipelothrix rhusiopathiae]MDE8059835.1 DUF262 domain-containing protein [Erysipelothrix rhusiopathiae]
MNILDIYTDKSEKVMEQLDDVSFDVDIEDNEEVFPVNNSDRKLYLDKVDKSTSDLFRMIREGELILQPSYQRSFVWDQKIMSRFIESLLLGIPIPTIFLSENGDSTLDVIDGQQRLTTLFAFMKPSLSASEVDSLNPKLSKDITGLKLRGLETLADFNKSTINDLDQAIRRKFNNVSLPIVIVQKDSSEDIKFDIFSRINQGSVKLNEQELRNVMYRGTLMDALNCVAEDTIVTEVFGNRPVLKKRFGFQEIILRARAFNYLVSDDFCIQETSYGYTYGGRLNAALVSYLKHYRDNDEEAGKLVTFAREAFLKVNLVFGENSFQRYSDSGFLSGINKTVAELQLVVLSKFSIEDVKENSELIKDSFIDFSKSQSPTLFTKATNNTTNLTSRYFWGSSIKELFGNNE